MVQAKPIRVLLVDDHVRVRQEVRIVLEQYPNIEVVGEANDGEEAIVLAGKLRPSVVVMDINMPNMDGVAATRVIRENYSQVMVVGFTSNLRGYIAHAMLKAGAFELLSKETGIQELYGAIQRAVASVQPVLIVEDQSSLSDEAPLQKEVEPRSDSSPHAESVIEKETMNERSSSPS